MAEIVGHLQPQWSAHALTSVQHLVIFSFIKCSTFPCDDDDYDNNASTTLKAIEGLGPFVGP